ncbi:hypothetical protein ACIQJ4_10470 [Streptomyces filamentosus]|uniref:hypothetical protein n=1 Tax=Streptomyces filamentosus TaxID=67294 RepID=UPI00381C2286
MPSTSRTMRRRPGHLPGMPTRAEIVERYCGRAGLSVENRPFYEVFGLFRLTVIAQQICSRHHHERTRAPAFRWACRPRGWPRSTGWPSTRPSPRWWWADPGPRS